MTDRAEDSAAIVRANPVPHSVEAAYLRLCEVEQRLDLLRHTVDGWSAWPVLRFEASLLLSGASFPHRQSLRRVDRALHAVGDLPVLMRPRRARHLVKTFASGLLEKSGNRYRDIWFDDVLLATGSSFKIEAAIAGFAEQSRQAVLKRNLTTSGVEIGAAMLARSQPSTEATAVGRGFGHVLREELSLPVGDDWATWRLQRFSATRRVYRSLLKRIKPSFVLVVDSGEHALVAAAKEHGSVVMEFQHGINDSTHAGYAWPASATRYRPMMPVPDRLLLHGEHWRRELSSGFWGDSLRVVGSPRIDRYRAEPILRSPDCCTVLVTTQGLDVERLRAFLAGCLQRLSRRVPLKVVVKLHPIHEADKAPYLNALSSFSDQVEILAGGEGASTFEWLKRAHLHVSIASASHYDAIGLGVPTVVLPLQTHELVLPLCDAGHAHLARTPEALAELVLAWQTLRLPDDISEYYFKSGAVENIRHELDLPAEGAI